MYRKPMRVIGFWTSWPKWSRGTTRSFPGTKRRKYLEENVADETVQLDSAQMKVLDDALAREKSLWEA